MHIYGNSARMPYPPMRGGYTPDGFGTFGDIGQVKASAPAVQKVGPPVDMTVVAIVLIVPCLSFVVVCGSLSLSMRKDSPGLAWAVVALVAVLTGICLFQAGANLRKRWMGLSVRDPFWYVFMAVTMAVASGSSFWLGELNYWNNVLPYIELQSLSSRFDVDVATAQGQQLMDVGRIGFRKGTRVDVSRAMGFKNVELYCVAPIVSGNQSLESYDLWAIGLDCCPGSPAAFRCGDYNNPNARAGLRVMREDQRAFYRLAVQQAEATFNIQAKHPLFFYWMEDPVAELESYGTDAQHLVYLGSASFCALHLVLVLGAVFLRTKIGRL